MKFKQFCLGFGLALVALTVIAATLSDNNFLSSQFGYASGKMYVKGLGLTNISASELLSGTLPAARLPSDGYASTYVNTSGDTMTGVLALPSGSAGAPSLHLGDSSSGLYRSAANIMNVTLTGTPRFQWDSFGAWIIRDEDALYFGGSKDVHIYRVSQGILGVRTNLNVSGNIVATGTFTGNGAGLTNLNASSAAALTNFDTRTLTFPGEDTRLTITNSAEATSMLLGLDGPQAGAWIAVNSGSDPFDTLTILNRDFNLGDLQAGMAEFFGTLTANVDLIVGGDITGAGGGITLDASGFNGNLTTSDNTLQEIAQKLDDLTGAADNLGNHIATTNLNMGGSNILNVGTISGGLVDFSLIGSNAFTGDGMSVTLTNGGATLTSNLVAAGIYGTGLTASRMLFGDANKKITSAEASGAVPINADGSATTFPQIQATAPSLIATGGLSQAFTFSNNVTVRGTLAADALTLGALNTTTLNVGSMNVTNSILATNGVGSLTTVAAVAISATGWTNIWSTNTAVVYIEGTAMTYTIKNNAGTPMYTNSSAVGNATVILQPSGAVTVSGTSVTGRAIPF